MKKNTTILIAHPDDEVIFGWPVLKEAKKIICCANDLTHPRMWGKDRKEALQEIGELVGAEVICLNNNCDFHALSGLTGELNRFVSQVNELIANEENIFTHNGWGEYGHVDHILVHTIAKMAGKPIFVTNIAVNLGWIPVQPWPLKNLMKECTIDLDFYNSCKAIYQRHRCWTWHTPDITEAKVYCE